MCRALVSRPGGKKRQCTLLFLKYLYLYHCSADIGTFLCSSAIHVDDRNQLHHDFTPGRGGVLTCFMVTRKTHLYSLNYTEEVNKKLATRMENNWSGSKVQFDGEDDLIRNVLVPGRLYMMSGAFPHGGDIYDALNIRYFFRVFTPSWVGGFNGDQFYIERRV